MNFKLSKFEQYICALNDFNKIVIKYIVAGLFEYYIWYKVYLHPIWFENGMNFVVLHLFL
jgi:hypothetical protein